MKVVGPTKDFWSKPISAERLGRYCPNIDIALQTLLQYTVLRFLHFVKTLDPYVLAVLEAGLEAVKTLVQLILYWCAQTMACLRKFSTKLVH